MYTCINGWTKRRMLSAIWKYNKGHKSTDTCGTPMYFADDGNRCSVGCYIPKSYARKIDEALCIEEVLTKLPNLATQMPLPLRGMGGLQWLHDNAPAGKDMRTIICEWIEKNVQDSEAA